MIKLEDRNLEEALENCQEDEFPVIMEDIGENKYPIKYDEIKKALIEIHNEVERGALLKSAEEYIKDLIEKHASSEIDTASLDNALVNLAYLNKHGKGHVEHVINTASSLINSSDIGLSGYEVFYLLCAIQVHDCGNIFGRKDHEKRIHEIIEDKCKPHIRDSFERRTLERIARAHGGSLNGPCDTISSLTDSVRLKGVDVHKRLIAAILRFSDELSDDHTRADINALERGDIPEGCRIYNRYSQAVESVIINKSEIIVDYSLYSNLVLNTFKKDNNDKYLLDEIYDRSLKMERERRYCMRFLRPYVSIDKILINISVFAEETLEKLDDIKYTLEEKGYPGEPNDGGIKIFGSDLRNGQEEKEYIAGKLG